MEITVFEFDPSTGNVIEGSEVHFGDLTEEQFFRIVKVVDRSSAHRWM